MIAPAAVAGAATACADTGRLLLMRRWAGIGSVTVGAPTNPAPLECLPGNAAEEEAMDRACLAIWREHGHPRWDDETGVADKQPVRHRIDCQCVSVEVQVDGVDHVISISSRLVHN